MEHLVDGRHAVPQVHSKVLCREVAVSTSGHSPTSEKRLAIQPSPLTSLATSLSPPCSPGPGDGKYLSL